MELVGDIALVTGGGRGIGRAIASELLQHGSHVVILELNPETAEKTAVELSHLAPSRSILTVHGSVASPIDVKEAFDLSERELGRPVQMLVNNAGMATLAPVAETTEEDWDTVMDVNLKGTFLCSREFSRRLIEAALPGAAVSISSLNYTAATDGLGHYCAAEAAVAQFTKVCAAEWGRHGLRANAIAAGSIRTPLTVDSGFLDGPMGEEFLARTPLGRIGEPEDVAKVAAFLLANESYWITGVTLSVDGGQHIRGLHSFWDTLNLET